MLASRFLFKMLICKGKGDIMHILVTNDDGVRAPGITFLAEALRSVGEVTVVAPDREMSAVGHALTLHHPLRATEIGPGVFAVEGTPTDCVSLGVHRLLTRRPDLVVSGINRGGNLGDDITYSGTVSAAMEANLMGFPAFAISLVASGQDGNYATAAQFAAQLARNILAKGLPADTFLNVNIPDLPADEVQGIAITTQGKRNYGGEIVVNTDPRGRHYFWIGSSEPDFRDVAGTDYFAVSRGQISITPLHLDLTNYASLEALKKWQLS